MSLISTKFSRSLLRISLSLPDCTKNYGFFHVPLIHATTTHICIIQKTQEPYTYTYHQCKFNQNQPQNIAHIDFGCFLEKLNCHLLWTYNNRIFIWRNKRRSQRSAVQILSITHPIMGFLLDIFISYEHKCAYFVLSRALNVVIKSSTLK